MVNPVVNFNHVQKRLALIVGAHYPHVRAVLYVRVMDTDYKMLNFSLHLTKRLAPTVSHLLVDG